MWQPRVEFEHDSVVFISLRASIVQLLFDGSMYSMKYLQR